MPFTLAHPAAVLPLRRFRFLQTVPLIIGSMTPDVPYYFPARYAVMLGETHSFHGTVFVCTPLGMVLLLMTYLLREPLTVLLSTRLRWLCLQSLERFAAQPWHWPLAVVSLLIGAWTHVIWDSFTHPTGWTALRVAALSAPVSIFGWDTEVSHFLQYASSIFGLGLLAYWLGRRLADVPENLPEAPLRPRTRWLLLLIIGGAALSMGALLVYKVWYVVSYYRLAYLLLTRVIAWFLALYLAAGLLVMINRRPEPEPAGG
jgi:hypothetical protein